MSLTSEIGSYLATQGLGTVGTTLFEGAMPFSPDSVVCVYERPGQQPVRTMGVTPVERPMLLVRYRDPDYETCYGKAKLGEEKLHNFSGTIGGVEYFNIAAANAIHSVGMDESSPTRFILEQSFHVMKGHS